MAKSGGINRNLAPSIGPKLAFCGLHAGWIAVCSWLAFGSFDWADPIRAKLLAACALLYFLRHVLTLFVLLKRRVLMSEVLGLIGFMAVFEIGFLLLGAGVLSSASKPFGWIDWIGVALVLVGSFLNSGSEVQRWLWKKKPTSKGRCYTEGLFAYSMHINYFGDCVLFTGWAVLAASIFAWPVPIFITASFIWFHIPALDEYLAERYGKPFEAYAAKTAKLVPFIY
jgi:steroid 5-alpha reductase family enzyme